MSGRKLSLLLCLMIFPFPTFVAFCLNGGNEGTSSSSQRVNDPIILTVSCIRVKDWERALYWVRQWTPASWALCGNSLESISAKKCLIEALLLTKLNRFDEIGTVLHEFFRLSLAIGHEHLFVTLVKEMYQKGQLQHLKKVLEEHRERANLIRASVSPNFILSVLELMEQGKVGELCELLGKDYEDISYKPSWQRHLLSWALKQIGKDAAERFLQRWQTLKLSDWEAIYTFLLLSDKRCWEQAWRLLLADKSNYSRGTAVYALFHSDKEVRDFVKEKASSPDEKDRELARWLLWQCQQDIDPIRGRGLWEGLFVEDF